MRGKLGVALLGAAMFHVDAWAAGIVQHDDARLVGVWDHETGRADELARRHQTPAVEDFEALLESKDVQAVAICAEHDRHEALAVAAARAGKHVICEKPMATSVEACDRMIAAFTAAQVMYFQSFQMRFDPVNHYVRDLVRSGGLGRVVVAHKRHSHGYDFARTPAESTWFLRPEQGGVLADVGIHAIDWVRWVLGEPARVSATASCRMGLGVPDTLVATYECPGDVLAIVHASWAETAGLVSTEIIGDGGALYQLHADPASVHAPRLLDAPLLVHRAGAPAWELPQVSQYFPKVHARMVQVFLDCILTGAPPPVSAADGRRAVELMLAAYRAADVEQTRTIPPMDEDG